MCLKYHDSGEVFKIKMEKGSLLVLTSQGQKAFKHGIMKERKILEPRISLTFRHFI
jgi:alkylated DNA repair dioxygenase AlkB